MYRSILKKDLKRKKTMNIILLMFIVLAVTFIAGGISNMTSIATAIDYFVKVSELADYEVFLVSEENVDKMEQFIAEHDYITDIKRSKQLTFSRHEVTVNNMGISYANTILAMNLEDATVHCFDENNEKIETIKRGEVYLSPLFMRAVGAEIGDKITIHSGSFYMDFIIVGVSKDIACSSAMMGITRFLINKEDFQEIIDSQELSYIYDYGLEVNDIEQVQKDIGETGIVEVFSFDHSLAKKMYVMDMVIAATLMLVSLCLIVISIFVLKFTIKFTIDEEFREIGVMKAIGIRTGKIRKIYLIKYFMISAVGSMIGFLLSIPFGQVLLENTMENIVVHTSGNIILELICSIVVTGMIVLASWIATRKINKMKPIEAIRNGATGERFQGKGVFSLSKLKVKPVVFMAVNDISSKWKQFLILFFAFVVGILLVIMPINTINTLQSDELVTWFNMTKSDIYMVKEQLFNGGTTKNDITEQLDDMKEILQKNNIEANVHQEIMFRVSAAYGENTCSSLAFQGLGDVCTEDYVYMKGSAPQQKNEVAVTHIIAKKLNADIGDVIEVDNGNEKKEYIITAVYQSMNNMGEGIRFYEEEEMAYEKAVGAFAIQVDFVNHLEKTEQIKSIEKIAALLPDYKVQTATEYLDEMMGGIADQISNVKQLIVFIVIVVNVLIVVLMEKTLIAKEKGEIGLLKAIGFGNPFLVVWQVLRIGFILFGAILFGVLLSTPFSNVTVERVFQMMGSASIEFQIYPLEVFVCYPLIVLVVTVVASLIQALSIKKISALETSSIE